MPYNLFITSPSGNTYKALRSPYDYREATRSTIRMITLADPDNGITVPEADTFALQVIDAPLGETTTHPVTGTSFRTEEI